MSEETQKAVVKTEEDLAGRAITESNSTAAEMVAEQTRAEVYGAMTLAKKFPRDEAVARELLLQTCQSIKFADKAIYKKPIGGGKHIEGGSIRLAEEALRHWGNIKILKSVIYDDPVRRIIRVVSYDLQTNTSYSEDAILEKTVERKSARGRTVLSERVNSYDEKVSTVVATEDEMMIKEGAKTSKMIRNTGLRLIPEHIKEEAIEKAKEVIRGGLSGKIDETISKIVESFSTIGVSVPELERYLGHPKTQLNADEIVDLKAIFRTIKDGEAKWADYIAGKIEDADVTKDGPEMTEWEKEVEAEKAKRDTKDQGFAPSDAKASKVTDKVGKGEQQ